MSSLVINPVKQLDLSEYKITIINIMSELAIIANPIIKDNNEYYFAGKQYLHYISFLGCSPYLNFETTQKLILSDFTETIADLNYVQIYFNSEQYHFKNTDFGVKAICPACRTRITEWSSLITKWKANLDVNIACPQCHASISITDIDWKKTAGFYKTAILFHGIQAELALPTDNLLAELKKLTKVEWAYFYG